MVTPESSASAESCDRFAQCLPLIQFSSLLDTVTITAQTLTPTTVLPPLLLLYSNEHIFLFLFTFYLCSSFNIVQFSQYLVRHPLKLTSPLLTDAGFPGSAIITMPPVLPQDYLLNLLWALLFQSSCLSFYKSVSYCIYLYTL